MGFLGTQGWGLCSTLDLSAELCIKMKIDIELKCVIDKNGKQYFHIFIILHYSNLTKTTHFIKGT